MFAAGVLLIGHQHFIAGLQVQAIGDKVVSLGRVAKQRDLIARAADKCRQRVAKFVPRPIAPDWIVLRILLGQAFRIRVRVKNGLQHRPWRGAHSAIVQIDFIAWNQELFSHLRPIRLLVFVV